MTSTNNITARQLYIGGQVQGVGFRPFVYRLAQTHKLCGWVQNQKGNVLIHIEGVPQALDRFKQDLLQQAPAIARPCIINSNIVVCEHSGRFEIRPSDANSAAYIHTPGDYFTCSECLHELNDPHNRRYQYPFINCTQCGPRYTLINKLPYDRANTTMRDFLLCSECQHEYNNPLDRRFHAEPIACAKCGPQLRYTDSTATVDDNHMALCKAVEALADGQIIAIKGIGGYHLLCDANNDDAILKLRTRKPRPDKPLAVMFPAAGVDELDALRSAVIVSDSEATLIRSPLRPIVLVNKQENCTLSQHIAPGLGQLGVLLPYSPLHHLLLHAFARPVVATSANISGEPLLTEQEQAQQRLIPITKTFLHHNRPIARPADDSLMRIIGGQERPIRIGRGMAPVELTLPTAVTKPTLAVGGHMKNTIALAWSKRLVISPHIGDLDSPRSLDIFEQVINDLQQLYEIKAEQVVCDAHRGYASHRWARQSGLPLLEVFHHYAHAATLELEYPHTTPWLVFTWDGVGYGPDNTLWGGEALLGRPGNWQRVASFKPFRIPGGDRAARQPWRSAAALCWQAGLDYTAPQEHELLRHAWEKDINCAVSSAAGRLFDAAATLTGLVEQASYEGQGPMLLEAHAGPLQTTAPLPVSAHDNILQADWTVSLAALMDTSKSISQRASQFHARLAATLVEQARLVRERYGIFQVGLSGGVFQNKKLTELAITLLEQQGFSVFLNRAIPCNDGGLCAGQIIEAAARKSP